MSLSFQLYGSRDVASQIAFLPELAAMGYEHVEGYGGVYDDPAALRAGLDAAGLTMPSGHIGLDAVQDTPDKVIEIARTLGMRDVFVPFTDLRSSDDADWTAFGKALAAAGQPLWDAGLTFGWHNHWFEFDATASGAMPLDLMLAADDRLALELDIAWVFVAGQDPAEWLRKHAGRIAAVHVKDKAPEGENADEDGWADVGHGIMPWGALKAQLAAELPDALQVMEHDKPADAVRFARRSIAAYSAL